MQHFEDLTGANITIELNKWSDGNNGKFLCYQVLRHVHSDGGHLLIVFTDHFLDDVGQVIIFCLFHHVQKLLHDGADVWPHVHLGYIQRHKKKSTLSF